MQDVTSSLISKFVSEIGEMQNRLNELEETNIELEEELGQLRCAKEESHVVKASLEEQLTKRESEMDVLMNNLKRERQAFEQSLGNLQQQFNTWLNTIFEGRK